MTDHQTDDVHQGATDTPAAPPAAPPTPVAPRPRRRWLGPVVYMLAGVGLLTLILIGVAMTRHPAADKAEPADAAASAASETARATIDETTVIDNVMTDTYGKYSAEKKGWLYVGDDNITYLMRVVQQQKITTGEAGDELYFVASGAAIDGKEDAMFGVFHVSPEAGGGGGLQQTNAQSRRWTKLAVRPEQVHFALLAKDLWGWTISEQIGSDPKADPVVTVNSIMAPHDGQIATLAEFLGAREAVPEQSCEEAKAGWEAFQRGVEKAEKHEREGKEEPDDQGYLEEVAPTRCEKRQWTYSMGPATGKYPAPITVKVSGMLDGQPAEPHTWKLVFDPKSFSYVVPEELQNR